MPAGQGLDQASDNEALRDNSEMYMGVLHDDAENNNSWLSYGWSLFGYE